jgi:hypothetical protein
MDFVDEVEGERKECFPGVAIFWQTKKNENHAFNPCTDCCYHSGGDHRRGAASPCDTLAGQRVARRQVPELSQSLAVVTENVCSDPDRKLDAAG